MKRFFTICIAALWAAASFAQVNVWSTNGYLTQFEKATLDSFTISMINPYTVRERSIAYWHTPTGETRDMFDLQKTLYVGLENLGYNRHNDFGWAAVCMLLDSRGQDYVSPNNGYNWFDVWGDPAKWRNNNTTTTAGLADYLVWYTCYKPILAANYVIATRTGGNEEDNYAVAQAKALRAFEYMQLAQAYQVAYSESSLNLPCVPLVLDTIYSHLILGQEPATVAQVYAQIKSDLDAACTNLEGYMRPSKHVINQAVAYGLRARYNLLVHKYNQAATDAEQALLLSGATPLSIVEANQPGFADASAHNVLWANIINEEDAVIQAGDDAIINWVSHMSTFFQQGYTGVVGATRSIASALYNEIPASDVRKGWWLNENLESPLLDAPGYNAAKAAIQSKSENVYVNVKFGTGDGTTSGRAAAAGDWIMMRAEELILLRAEALARAGKDGAAVLKDFMKTYRDPSYDIDAHGLSVADEIWWQRRVELWGEGFAFGDLMRLHKGVVRTTSTNWPDAWAQDVPAGDERFPLAIPAKDEDYKVLAVWRNGEKDLYNTYCFTIDRVDSITLGEAKEINDVQFYGCEARNGINRIYTYNFSQPLQRSVKEEEMATHPDTLTISFYRNHNRREAITVPLIVEADEAFANTNFPSEISLCGYNDTTCQYNNSYYTEIQIVVSNMPLGTHQFTITIPDEYAQGITDAKSFTYEITVREPDEWDEAEIHTGVFVDQTVGPAFGIGVNAWFVEYQIVEQPDGSQKIRIHNPYASFDTSQDADGIFDGDPIPYDGEVDTSKDYNFVLNISPDGEVRFPDSYTYLGIGWGDYTEQCFVDYARGTGAAGTYGRYEKENGKIVFDAQDNSMLFGAGGSIYGVQANFVFYLSKAAYLADQEEGGEAVDADVNTYVGNWKLQGRDLNTDAGAEAEVVIATNEDADGQYYTIEGIHPDVPVVYGIFNEEDHRLNIYPSRGTPVEKGGVTYNTTFYALNSSYSTSAQITIDFEPAGDGTLVLSANSDGIGFAVLYENPDDQVDYDFAMAWDQLQFAPSEAAGIPAKVAKRNGKQSISAPKVTVKRPAKKLVKKNIRLLNSNKEFQKNE